MVTSTNLDNPHGPPPPEQETLPPVWLQRAAMVVYVTFCILLGMYLIVLPWTWWFEVGPITRWPVAQSILQHGFVRGAVSGLGLIDIWLGVSEAVHYHDRR